MGETYTKFDLVKELALTAHISRRRMEAVLESLAQIAYREAHKGFAVPGICRLDVVHRNSRLVRNPKTNQTLRIAEHNALRVRPVKRAKDAIAPTPRAVIELPVEPEVPATPPVDAPAQATTLPAVAASSAAAITSSAPAAAAPATPAPQKLPYTVVPPPVTPFKAAQQPPAPAPAPLEEESLISFRCKACKQEIEATIEMIGAPNECPTCGEPLHVPQTSDPGTIWYLARANSAAKTPPAPSQIAAMKGRTIRIELPDDL